MIRLTSLLTIALGIVFCLTISTADARSKRPPSNCETRIFKKDENEACFAKNGELYRFEKQSPAPTPELVPGGSTSGFTLASGGAKYLCGCQLRSKYNLICVGEKISPDHS